MAFLGAVRRARRSRRQLAGRPARGMAGVMGRALGTRCRRLGGGRQENPVDTLGRELHEEWSVVPEHMTVEALVRLPQRDGVAGRPGVACRCASVTPDHEHDRVRVVAGRAWSAGRPRRMRRCGGWPPS